MDLKELLNNDVLQRLAKGETADHVVKVYEDGAALDVAELVLDRMVDSPDEELATDADVMWDDLRAARDRYKQ
jgi:transcription initiation factor IIE alpha subunit